MKASAGVPDVRGGGRGVGPAGALRPRRRVPFDVALDDAAVGPEPGDRAEIDAPLGRDPPGERGGLDAAGRSARLRRPAAGARGGPPGCAGAGLAAGGCGGSAAVLGLAAAGGLPLLVAAGPVLVRWLARRRVDVLARLADHRHDARRPARWCLPAPAA